MPTDAGSDVINLPLIPTLVLGASSTGALISAWLICFRGRRNGLWTLAAISAATAIVVGVLVAPGSTLRHGAVSGIEFATIPLIVAVLFCVPVAFIRLALSTISRVFGGVSMYWRNLGSDMRQIALHRANASKAQPKPLSKQCWVTATVLGLATIMMFGLNAKTISDFASRVAPKLSVVTNTLDLLSFVLATPKLFTTEIKNRLLIRYILTLRSHTFGKVQFPMNVFTYSLGALLFVCTFTVFPFVLLEISDRQGVRLQQLLGAFSARGLPVAGYLGQRLAEDREVFTKMWVFLSPVIVVPLVMSISVIFLNARAKVSKAKQDEFADKALFWALVIFAYARALSMMA